MLYNAPMRLIKFLGSLGFALALIAGLALLLSVSTILESIHGTPYVQENFYQAHWFDFFLALLWVNIFCATLTRWPFKKKHVGFVITHIGILTLLLGSFGTRVWGREGQMTLFEDEAKNRMLQTGFSLHASLPGGGEKIFNLKTSPLKKPISLPLENAPYRLVLSRVFPHAEETRFLEEAPGRSEPNHALHATLSSEMLGFKQDILLLEHDPADADSAAKTIGPAAFVLENSSADPVSQLPKLRLTQSNGTVLQLSMNDNEKTAEWKETGLNISNLHYYPKARVENNRLVNLDSAAHLNPAVEFEISDASGKKEHHTRFSLFPEFESLRGGSTNSVFGLKVELLAPREAAADSGPSFRFLVSGDNKWSYRVHSMKTGLSETRPLPLKEPIPTGWMDMSVRVDQTFDRARIVTKIREDRDGRSETPAIELRIRREGMPEETRRLLLGRSLLLGTKNSSMRLTAEPRSEELPFSLGLLDFRKIDYPGTSKPAAFESDVVLRDASSGVTLERTISMNKPLDYLGYRVFQSSFIQDEQLGEASVFSIAKNPGMPAIYVGAAFIFLGVILLFYFHPFFTGKKI